MKDQSEISPETVEGKVAESVGFSVYERASDVFYKFVYETHTLAYVRVANNNITRVLLVRWRVMNGQSGCQEGNSKAKLLLLFFYIR